MSKNELILSITGTMKNLREIEAVNNELIADTKADLNGGLKAILSNNRINHEEYLQQMEQLTEELNNRLQAQKQISQNIVRLESIRDQKNKLMCFVIPENIEKKELVSLMQRAKLDLETSKNKDEKSLLRAILPFLETHKNMMDEGKKPPKKIIPITKNEEIHLFLLLGRLNGDNLDAIKAYLMQLDELKKLRENVDVKVLCTKKSKVVDTLLDSLVKETESTLVKLTAPNCIKENIAENYRVNVENHLDNAAEQAKELKGIKMFINKICELIGIEPIFVSEKDITDSLKFCFFYTQPKGGENKQPSKDNEHAPLLEK